MNDAQRKLNDIRRRQSEAREKHATLAALETRDGTQQAEYDRLDGELTGLEVEYRGALAAVEAESESRVTTEDAEHRERLELRGRVTLGAYVLAALQGREPTGAEAEFRAAHGVTRPGHMPLDLFEVDRPAVEERAVTPTPASGTGVTVAPVQPFLFAPSIAPRLGIAMPSVGSGGFSEMTITTALPAAPKAKGTAADGTAGALTAVSATPKRIASRLSLAAEDIAAIGVSNFESAMRQNASMALSDAYDNQCINGNGSGVNVNGLINQLDDPTDPTVVADFDAFVAAFADALDGLWASMVSEVSILANVDAYKLSAKTFRDRIIDQGQRGGVSLGDESAASYLARTTGGWWTNKRMPATASDIARGIVYRKGRPGMRTASHPTWGSVGIDDIYSDSASGVRHFTMYTLVGSKVLIVQPDAYDLVEFKTA